MFKSLRGFTIIELIVVISIISILAGIVIFNVVGYTKKSQQAALITDINQISTVATNYFETNGDYKNLHNNSKIDQIAKSIGAIQPYYMYLVDEGGQYGQSGAGDRELSICTGEYMVGLVSTTGTPSVSYCIDSSGNVSTYSTPIIFTSFYPRPFPVTNPPCSFPSSN